MFIRFLSLLIMVLLFAAPAYAEPGYGWWRCNPNTGAGCGGSGGGKLPTGVATQAALTTCLTAETNSVYCVLDRESTWDLDAYTITPADLAGAQTATIDCNGATINRASGASTTIELSAGTPTNNDANADYQWYTFKNCIFTADDQGIKGDIASIANNGSGVVRVTDVDHGLSEGYAYVGIYNLPRENNVSYNGIHFTSYIDADNFDLLNTVWDAAHVGSTGQWAEHFGIVTAAHFACSGFENDCDNKVIFQDNILDPAGSLEGSTLFHLGKLFSANLRNLDAVFRGNKGRISGRTSMYISTELLLGSLTSFGDEIEGFKGPEYCDWWDASIVNNEYPHKSIFLRGDKWKWCGGWRYATLFTIDANITAVGIGRLNTRAPLEIAGGNMVDFTMRVGGENFIVDERWAKDVIVEWILQGNGLTNLPARVRINWFDSFGCPSIGASEADAFLDVDDVDGNAQLKGEVWEITQLAINDNNGCTRDTPFSAAILSDFQSGRPVSGFYKERVHWSDGYTRTRYLVSGVETTIPPHAQQQPVVFCGQLVDGSNGDDEVYGGPDLNALNGTAWENALGGATCNGLENTTVGDADLPLDEFRGYRVSGMMCQISDVAASEDTTFTFYDDEVATALTCMIDQSNSETSCATDMGKVDQQALVAANSDVAVEAANDTDDESAEDFRCIVYISWE